jgi:glucose-6-phosphate 1-epimerase
MSPDTIALFNARHALPGLATLIEGANGLPKIHITTPAATAEIYLHGAHVTSWRPAGHEDVLFLSRHSLFAPGKAIRGGIPICFPWFGPKTATKPDGPPAPQHGFARTAEWTLDSIEHHGDSVVVTLSLASSPASHILWPSDFRAQYRVTVGAQLILQLDVTNTGSSPLTFTEALHTYHHVGDATQVRISGLDATHYLDNRDSLREKLQHGDITFPGPAAPALDNIYLDTTARISLHDPALARTVTVDKQHSSTTVVWNPGADGAAALTDLADEEWQYFACIEASNVRSFAVPLAPGESHTLTAILSVTSTA